MRNAIAIILIFLAHSCVPTALAAQSDRTRIVNCKLIVDGIEYIAGKCRFLPQGRDGSFQIMSGNGKYFAQVNVESTGIGYGYWNEEAYANHAHSDIGLLMREDACWVNERASVCAW